VVEKKNSKREDVDKYNGLVVLMQLEKDIDRNSDQNTGHFSRTTWLNPSEIKTHLKAVKPYQEVIDTNDRKVIDEPVNFPAVTNYKQCSHSIDSDAFYRMRDSTCSQTFLINFFKFFISCPV